MPTTTRKEVSAVQSPEERILDMFLNMTEAEFLILWKWGGYGGHPPKDVDRRMVAMLKGFTARARREVGRAFARAFASTRPQERAALVALLLTFVVRPTGMALPAPAPRVLTSQRGWHRLTPARAP